MDSLYSNAGYRLVLLVETRPPVFMRTDLSGILMVLTRDKGINSGRRQLQASTGDLFVGLCGKLFHLRLAWRIGKIGTCRHLLTSISYI